MWGEFQCHFNGVVEYYDMGWTLMSDVTSDIRVFKMSVPVMKSNPLSALIR